MNVTENLGSYNEVPIEAVYSQEKVALGKRLKEVESQMLDCSQLGHAENLELFSEISWGPPKDVRERMT